MNYISKYNSPFGEMIIASDENMLIGVWFSNQKYCMRTLSNDYLYKETKVIKDTKRWLDIYFSGNNPEFKLPIYFNGTDFENEVWKTLCSIPYGSTITYKKIADILAMKRHIKKMSAQAVGKAIGRNPILIIVPCHRVIGTNGKLIGYAGGLDRKEKLLNLEKILYMIKIKNML